MGDLFTRTRNAGGVRCKDANILDGTTQELSWWKNQIMPGSTYAQCGGNCNCEMNPAKAGAEASKNTYYVNRNGARATQEPLTQRSNGQIVKGPENKSKIFEARKPMPRTRIK